MKPQNAVIKTQLSLGAIEPNSQLLFIFKRGKHFALDFIIFLNLDRWCFSALMPSENTVEGF